jgi:hypothetical protein
MGNPSGERDVVQRKNVWGWCLLTVLVTASGVEVPAAERPNIVVILVDDLGFSDLGCYGSEIATPTLDRLAAGGLRMSQFYNTAKCHASRVSLLTGRWCRQAGDESLRRAVTIPEILEPAGYFTAMAGKWHLSQEPTNFGFQRYFGHLSGATNYYRGDNTFRLNGEPFEVPASTQPWPTLTMPSAFLEKLAKRSSRFSFTWLSTLRTLRCSPSKRTTSAIWAATTSAGMRFARNGMLGRGRSACLVNRSRPRRDRTTFRLGIRSLPRSERGSPSGWRPVPR